MGKDPDLDPEFEWDEHKDDDNFKKHGIRFGTAKKIWSGSVFDGPDDREEYGEERFKAIGSIDNRVVVIVYTLREERRRIISARKANRNEREAYSEAVAHCTRRGTD